MSAQVSLGSQPQKRPQEYEAQTPPSMVPVARKSVPTWSARYRKSEIVFSSAALAGAKKYSPRFRWPMAIARVKAA